MISRFWLTGLREKPLSKSRAPQTLIAKQTPSILRSRSAAVPTHSTSNVGAKRGHETLDWLQAEAELARENHAAPAETVKSNRKPPVTKSGKSNPKQVEKVEIVDAR